MHKESSLNSLEGGNLQMRSILIFTVHYNTLTLLSEHETLAQSNMSARVYQQRESRVASPVTLL